VQRFSSGLAGTKSGVPSETPERSVTHILVIEGFMTLYPDPFAQSESMPNP
jgi:hypothetical protein